MSQVRDTLSKCPWALLHYHELKGNVHERLFVDVGEHGQFVGVDIVLSGKLGTPVLSDEASHETIRPSFETPKGDRVPVIALDWQVEGKLAAWFSRRKNSDFDDLLFLFRTYGKEIVRWSGQLQKEWRVEFMEAYKLEPVSEKEHGEMKRTLHLED